MSADESREFWEAATPLLAFVLSYLFGSWVVLWFVAEVIPAGSSTPHLAFWQLQWPIRAAAHAPGAVVFLFQSLRISKLLGLRSQYLALGLVQALFVLGLQAHLDTRLPGVVAGVALLVVLSELECREFARAG